MNNVKLLHIKYCFFQFFNSPVAPPPPPRKSWNDAPGRFYRRGPVDTTETVAEHSARLQPSINLHSPVTAFMFSCSGTQMYYPGGMKARVSPVQWSKPHSILAPLRIQTRVAGFRIISGDHYTTTTHLTLSMTSRRISASSTDRETLLEA